MSALITAVLPLSEFLFLPPICLAIALVTSASHRDDMREILRASVRSWLTLMAGIVLFGFAVSLLFQWLLP